MFGDAQVYEHFSAEGPGHGEHLGASIFASGGSHGGDGGAESKSYQSPSAYGSFVEPVMFGSAGGDADTSNKGLFLFLIYSEIALAKKGTKISVYFFSYFFKKKPIKHVLGTY